MYTDINSTTTDYLPQGLDARWFWIVLIPICVFTFHPVRLTHCFLNFGFEYIKYNKYKKDNDLNSIIAKTSAVPLLKK